MIDLKNHFRDIAMEIYPMIPYHQKLSDFVSERYGNRSYIYQNKILEAYEDIFLFTERGR